MKKNTKVICFGEILWDILPHGMKPGGAPLNVAYHLRRLGINSRIISRVGMDELGRNLLELIQRWGILSDLCSVDSQYATSKVMATIDEQNEVQYEILFPVAWDFIRLDNKFLEIVSNADAFVFGSLAMRHEVTKQTLFSLLDHAGYKVFDVNLRYPFYSKGNVLRALNRTDLLKLNLNELDIICSWIDPNPTEEDAKVILLQNNFNIREILLTKGSEGASYYTNQERFEVTACRIKVADTVGSGDAFLAGFLSGKFNKENEIPDQLSFASVLGGFVAAKEGACPEYNEADLQQFKTDHVL